MDQIAALEAELDAERARTAALVEQVVHRVGNDLATIAVLLGARARGLADAGARAALKDAETQLRLVADAQRRLGLVENLMVSAAEALEPAVALLAARWAADEVAVDATLGDKLVRGRDALGLVLLAGELVAAAAAAGGPVRVALDGDGLSVAGVAAPPPPSPLVGALARGLRATVAVDGAAVLVRF